MKKNKKIQILIELEINEEVLKKDNITVQDLINDTVVYPEDFVDGFLITRAGRLKKDPTSHYYYGQDAKVLDIKETEG